ncbi:MAG: hypothetical protein ACQESK_07695 [Bacteroidota bacterium]
MENHKAQKLIKKINDDLEHAGIIYNTLSKQLKELRPYAVEEELPVVAKALRLAYEHLDEYETFVAPIPQEEPVQDLDEDEETSTDETEEVEKITGSESMIYFINLIKNPTNPINVEELRDYIAYLEDFAN